jgi:septum formation protein
MQYLFVKKNLLNTISSLTYSQEHLMPIILASSSLYRRRLLQRLLPDFRCEIPFVDETSLAGEQPQDLALRLALEKAREISARYPEALVIGSDQVASLDGRIMGKPGGFEAAREQLLASSGRKLCFYTGLALVGPEGEQFHVEPFTVHFRRLENKQIENYLQREQPFDCAGSFKCEGLGIALFRRMQGDDPTSLEGLPLIALTRMLEKAGSPVLG